MFALCLLFCLSGATGLHAQDCYQKALREGQNLFYKGEHEEAKKAWEKGKKCPGADIAKLDEKIRSIDDLDLDGVLNKLDKCPFDFGAKETDGCPCADVHHWLGIDKYYDNKPDSALVEFNLAKNCSDALNLKEIETWEAKIAKQRYAYDTNQIAKDNIFKVVEKKPEFPGGEVEMLKFLYLNLRYPAIARENGVEGTVYIRYIVESDGYLSHIEVIKDVGAGLGNEAARVIKTMPRWEPGMHEGKPVRVMFALPVKYRLE